MIIFLDIDGVLNHYKQPLGSLDESNLRAFAILYQNVPNPEIVISSSWRMNPIRYNNLRQKLQTLGFKIIDHTDTFPGTRAEQIERWLDKNRPQEDEWFIIDDDEELVPGRTLVTNYLTGLTEVNIRDWLLARKK